MTLQLDLFPRETTQLAPGTHHLPNWLPIEHQNAVLTLLRHCTQGGWYTPQMKDGTPMKHPLACVGYQWRPYEYFDSRCPVPGEFILMAIEGLKDAGLSSYLPYQPDTGIVNYFPPASSLGMHQDKSESQEMIDAGSPIVTLSLGDSATFRLGNPYTNGAPYQDIELRSGDLLIMAGRSRLAYHSVTRIHPDTCPPDLQMKQPGRISLTLRQVYPLKN